MADFTVVVSDPDSGTTVQREIDGQDANRFVNREIGDEVDGDALGLTGYTLEISGGSDDAGRPLRGDVAGPDLKAVLLDGGVGFAPSRDGERKRITVRGREISDSVAQVNATIVEHGEESVEDLLADDDEE